MHAFVLRLAALIAFALFAGEALADDWNVVRLRGTVLELVDGNWQPLERGSVVPDSRVVRTMGNSHATLTRGNEIIELASNTQIQIYDQGGGKPFTTVVEHFGSVAIEAEVRNVQHFAVKNQYLAAVVKGTRFVVTAGRSGGTVEVQRGHVEVDSSTDHTTTLLAVGQKAKADQGGSMSVSGQGQLPAVVKKGDKAAAKAAKAAERAASVDDHGVGKSNSSDDTDHSSKGGGDDENSSKSDEDSSGKGGGDDSSGKSDEDSPSRSGSDDNEMGEGADDAGKVKTRD